MPGWFHSTWFLALACFVALAAGGGAGVAVGTTSGDAEVRTTTETTTAEPQTVTETETVTETKTETETTDEPKPPESEDDQDGDGCSDSYDAESCVTPYEGVDDVNCDDVDATDIEVLGEPHDDPYGLDGYDGDGVACES